MLFFRVFIKCKKQIIITPIENSQLSCRELMWRWFACLLLWFQKRLMLNCVLCGDEGFEEVVPNVKCNEGILKRSHLLKIEFSQKKRNIRKPISWELSLSCNVSLHLLLARKLLQMFDCKLLKRNGNATNTHLFHCNCECMCAANCDTKLNQQRADTSIQLKISCKEWVRCLICSSIITQRIPYSISVAARACSRQHGRLDGYN